MPVPDDNPVTAEEREVQSGAERVKGWSLELRVPSACILMAGK